MSIIKSISYDQDEILQWIIDLYCPNGFELDPTYSKGNFYKKISQPKFKFDINPQLEDVREADVRDLPLLDNCIQSAIFDPPFIVAIPKKYPTGVISCRFGYYRNIQNELWSMYHGALEEFYRVLKKDGERVRIKIKSAGVIGENTDESQYQYFEGRPIEEGEEFILNAVESADDLDGEKIDEGNKKKYRPVFLTDNAITLSDGIQLIIRFYGDADEIHKNYDFVSCTNYWISDGSKLVLRPEALESIIAKELFYVGSKYPICSFIRVRKFLRQG